MIPTDVPTMKARLVEMFEAMNAKAPTDAAMRAWFVALRDYPIDEVVSALDRWLLVKAKPPAPAEIRSLCAARLSDRIERDARQAKGDFEAGARRVLSEADRAIGRQCLAKARAVLRIAEQAAGVDSEARREVAEERAGMRDF